MSYMRAVIQRVNSASVKVNEQNKGEINSGLLVFLGIGKDDEQKDADYLVNKIIELRIFEDNDGKMNLSAVDLDKGLLIISQFTLYGDCRRGKRPSFSNAAGVQKAKDLYNYFIEHIKESGLKVETGEFQAMMDVELVNNGPVTILLDSQKKF